MQPIKPISTTKQGNPLYYAISILVVAVFAVFFGLALVKSSSIQKEANCTQISLLLEQVPIEYEYQKIKLQNEYYQKCFISKQSENE